MSSGSRPAYLAVHSWPAGTFELEPLDADRVTCRRCGIRLGYVLDWGAQAEVGDMVPPCVPGA